MSTKQAKPQNWLTKEQEIVAYKAELKDNFLGDARTKIIYYRQTVDGIRYKFSCKTKSPAVAYRYAPGELKKRQKSDDTPVTQIRYLVKDLTAKYAKERQLEVDNGELDPSTMSGIKLNLSKIDAYFGEQYPEIFVQQEDSSQADQKDFSQIWKSEFCPWFKVTYPGKGKVPAMDNVVKYMNAFLRYCHERGHLPRRVRVDNPNKTQVRLARKKKKNRSYNRREWVLMRRRANRRDRLTMSLGGFLAFRMSDCAALRKSLLVLEGDDPVVKFEGDDKAEYFVDVPLPKRLVRSLRSYIRDFPNPDPESDFVFWQKLNPKQHLKSQQFEITETMRAAGVNFGTHHTLRHTRLSLDFSNPKIPDSDVMIFRRVSYQVALEHYIKPTEEARSRMRTHSEDPK